jgi:hypothetical protein
MSDSNINEQLLGQLALVSRQLEEHHMAIWLLEQVYTASAVGSPATARASWCTGAHALQPEPLLHVLPAIDSDVGAGHKGGLFARQVSDESGYFFRFA